MCVVVEKCAVIFFKVSVVMPAWLEHSIDVALQPLLGVVATILADQLVQLYTQLKVDRVFSSFEELMVVNAALAPVLGLVVEDVAAFVTWLVF